SAGTRSRAKPGASATSRAGRSCVPPTTPNGTCDAARPSFDLHEARASSAARLDEMPYFGRPGRRGSPPVQTQSRMNDPISMATERTLAILKPDCVRKNLIGAVVKRIQEAGFTIRAMKLVRLTKQEAE